MPGAGDPSRHNIAWALAIQPDGRAVVAGETVVDGLRFALARYGIGGRLDPSFGSGGKRVSGPGSARAIALQTDGRIVVAGQRGDPSTFAIRRYRGDGRLDAGFGRRGEVLTGFGSNSEDWARSVRIQGDGRIVVAGFGGANDLRFALARYTAIGRLDRSFGRGGKVLTNLGPGSDGAFSLVIQPDRKIVAAGRKCFESKCGFALVRYTAGGRLDRSFGRDGKVVNELRSESIDDVVLAAQAGRFVVAGSSGLSSHRDFALARYTADGLLDVSFGKEGTVLTDFGSSSDDTPFALIVQPDRKILVVGRSRFGDSTDVALARYTPDGHLDSSFGGDGTVLTDFGSSGDQAFGAALQVDGKPIAAGWRLVRGRTQLALARYTTDGRLDPTFGRGGKVLTTF